MPGLAGDRVSRRHQLPEQVAAYVRELIISGLARPGEFLRVERIAEEVGVSNTPVREGLLALRSEGFVQFVPRRGFVVAPFTRDDVTDLFWAQAQLARELAARDARKSTTGEGGPLGLGLHGGDGSEVLLGHYFGGDAGVDAGHFRGAMA